MSIVDVHYGCALLGALSVDMVAFVDDVSCWLLMLRLTLLVSIRVSLVNFLSLFF